MAFFKFTPAPYDPIEWFTRPVEERAKAVCQAWAMQGYGTPLVIFALYALKVCAYIAVWALFCTLSPSLGGITSIASWCLRPVAFQKAIVWSLLFEVMGLGCGSGPLTGRYYPPIGGLLYFLRVGTTKLALFPRLPVLGGRQRTVVDVALYAALLLALLRALLAPTPTLSQFLPIVVLVPLLGVADKTLFLAARAEHYWVGITCFAFAQPWIAGAKAIQLALWFWAGVSKLNHHFPTVVCTMVSNSPYIRFPWLLRRMYRNYPDDLRPSGLATLISHGGTLLEFSVPLAFMLTPLGAKPIVGICLMLMLHGFITSNVPIGVPLEWNVAVMYSGFALFWAHPDISLTTLGPAPMVVFLVTMLVALPLFGNLVPSRLSFLLSMRYYAGNWPCSVWLFRGETFRKISQLPGSGPVLSEQLARRFDPTTVATIASRGLAFRLMHLQGRVMLALLPTVVDNIDEYAWVDGELVASMALGWNFGDGHLHGEQLLEAIQAQCHFEAGDVRCIMVESQPMGQPSFSYRIVDAYSGPIAAGEMPIRELRDRQPWKIGV